jgi:hypothetical protein
MTFAGMAYSLPYSYLGSIEQRLSAGQQAILAHIDQKHQQTVSDDWQRLKGRSVWSKS